jgi:hypothetical protein
MTTNHHTAIPNGAAANAATINSPLSQLDTKITSQEMAILLRSKVWSGKTTAPTVNDDSGDGYAIGDRWIDTTNDQEYVAVDVTVGAAVWKQTTKTTAVSTLIDGLILTWNSGTSVTVGIGSCYAENGSFIDVTSALVKSSLSLTPNTWYHIYVYLSGGTPTAEVVTTAPVAWKGTAYSKTGDTSRRYRCSIKTDGSGNVLEFAHIGNNSIIYKNVDSSVAPFRVLTAGTALTATAVAVSGVVPVTSRAVHVRMINLGTGQCSTNETSVVTNAKAFGIAYASTAVSIFAHPIDASQQIWYLVGAGGSLFLDVLGYQFNS